MEKLTLEAIRKAVGGIIEGECRACEIDSVSTDTRNIAPGSLFVPIKGEKFDGHDFIGKAYELGAAAALSEHRLDAPNIILVPDTRAAYLQLAGYYRRLFPVTVIGVTGSVGKTTTKEMIACVLESRLKTLKTEGNFNNEIGLPRTLLRLDSSYQAAVIEMGMSHFGEISKLSCCAAPSIGVITNIGVSHIENLGSREGIRKAKLEILDGMESNAPLILNADDALLSEIISTSGRRIVSYGIDNQNAEVRAVDIKEQNLTTTFDIVYDRGKVRAALPAVGRHNVLNALAAFAVGLSCNIAPAMAAAALEQYAPTGMRQRMISRGGMTVIEDCYNASPDSMRAALNVLAGMTCSGKRIAVLADMLELGTYAKEAHQQVGRMAADSKTDMLFCTGTEAEQIADAAKEAGLRETYFYKDRDKLAEAVKAAAVPGDCVLFKGSRGMRLEEVIKKIYRES